MFLERITSFDSMHHQPCYDQIVKQNAAAQSVKLSCKSRAPERRLMVILVGIRSES